MRKHASVRITEPAEFVDYYKIYGSIKAVARATGTPFSTLQVIYARAVAEGLMKALPLGGKTKEHITAVMHGKVEIGAELLSGAAKKVEYKTAKLKKGRVTRFLLSSAQNNTRINDEVWKNLLALKGAVDAELHIGCFSYIKNGLGARGDKSKWKNGFFINEPTADFCFDQRLVPYMSHEPLRLAKGLVWRGEQNLSPTAVNPLSGMESMTGRDSAIFPHVKTEAESIASVRADATKMIYTTGTVTMRNYILKKEGAKADFHHSYGAILVEVDEDQNWFVTQITADDETGELYCIADIGEAGCIRVRDGKVTTGHRALGIAWGDTHVDQIDPTVRKIAHGPGGMLDTLKPKSQFWHDLLDFYSRNHHETDDEFSLLKRYLEGRGSVRKETEGVVDFVKYSSRRWCHSVVVDSNHDRALMKWLRNHKKTHDPENLLFRNEMRHRFGQAMKAGEKYIGLKDAYLIVTGDAPLPKNLQFLHEDDQYLIADENGNGIEMGMHGDRGPNGSRGGRKIFTKMGRRCVIGHSHSAGISAGVYQTGTSSVLDPEYAKGPSSWTHTHCVIFPNGKRTLVTMWRGKWRA